MLMSVSRWVNCRGALLWCCLLGFLSWGAADAHAWRGALASGKLAVEQVPLDGMELAAVAKATASSLQLKRPDDSYFAPEARRRSLRLAQVMPHQPPTRRRPMAPKADADTITGITSVLNVTASFNLLGLRIIATIGYKWRLYASSSRALRDNYFSINAISRLTPAWMEFGAVAALQPAAFVKLRTAYRFRFQIPAFFSGGVFQDAETAKKAFDNVKSFSEGEQVLRDQIDAKSKANNDSRVLPLSQIFSVDLTLRFKIKGFLMLANARYSYWSSSYADSQNQTAFYEGGHDMIFSNDEHFFMVEGVLGYEWRMLRFLAAASFRKAFVANSDYFRLGPAVQWIIAPKWGAFKSPSLLVLVNWYVVHTWRGRDYVPLIAARFGGEF